MQRNEKNVHADIGKCRVPKQDKAQENGKELLLTPGVTVGAAPAILAGALHPP